MGERTLAGLHADMRISRKHKLNLHNSVVKLLGISEDHTRRRERVENWILHLVLVHNVPMTEQLEEMFRRAKPSEKMMSLLFSEANSPIMA